MAIRTPKIYTKSQWNCLSKERKAVIIAADTIQWIKLGKFTPQSGVYCQLSDEIVEKPHDIRHTQNKCIGCAKGGLFYSKCMARNQLDTLNLVEDEYLTLPNFTTYYDPSDGLLDVFTYEELEDIEKYFEGWRFPPCCYQYDNNWTLLFICLHIIQNKGHVRLNDLYYNECVVFHNQVVLPFVRRNRSLQKVLSKKYLKELKVE
jgi:hypothetical protein